MDRIDIIKRAFKKLKRQRFKPKEPKEYTPRDLKPIDPSDIEAIRARNNEKVKRVYKYRKENGLCERCNTPAVILAYEHKGKRLITRTSSLCPNHWASITLRQEMQNAIKSNTTIHTVHPMVTLGAKSDANHTN